MNNINKNFQKNLIRLLRENKKTQKELAQYLGISNPTVNNYVKGHNVPRMGKIDEIAKFFGVNRNELLGLETAREQQNTKKGVKIPVLGSVIAGVPVEAIEDVIDYEEITEEMARTGDFFALQIKGDSMEPRMENGDIVIVKKQSTANSGDIVIALVNGDEATCKRYKRIETGIMLLSTNPDYEPMFFTWEQVEHLPVEVIGKVVELRAKF